MLHEFIQHLDNLLTGSKRIVIVSHRNPDGDALGSSLGWMLFLRKLGHTINYVSPNSATANLGWMPRISELVSFEDKTTNAKAKELIAAAEVIFCLDFNAITRLEELGSIITASTAAKVMIDHHQQPEDFATFAFNSTAHAATCEMVYDVIEAWEKTELIDTEIAELLYTGLCTDTGFFQFSNATPNVFKAAQALVAKGIRPDYISDKVLNIFHEKRLRFFGYCLQEKMKLVKGGKVAYMSVNQKDIKRFEQQQGDSEGLVNYPFKIEGVLVSVFFSEEPDKVKISFRSRGDELDMNTFARTYFEGGGHFNAAGGKCKLPLAETEQKFLDALDSLPL